MAQTKLIVDGFFPEARKLRGHFDEVFADPRSTRGDRFSWDYWHIPDQYTLLRTPAYHFFPKKLYESFHQRLALWGRENLGCHDISPPWLSCYVDGCEQQLHGDLPHGPWAFVYSLTPWQGRIFRGGETLLVRDSILSYWESQASTAGLEQDRIFEKVPPKFDRLVVFDPRVPHGVKRVEGVHDVRQGRLVIHGWFVQPRPFIRGPLAPTELQVAIEGLSEALGRLFSAGVTASGVLSVRFGVNRAGKVASAPRVLSNTLRSAAEREILREIGRYLRATKFRRQRGASIVTLPLVFELR